MRLLLLFYVLANATQNWKTNICAYRALYKIMRNSTTDFQGEFADIYYDISDYLAYAKIINPQIFFSFFLFFVSMLDTVGRHVWKRFWQFNQ